MSENEKLNSDKIRALTVIKIKAWNVCRQFENWQNAKGNDALLCREIVNRAIANLRQSLEPLATNEPPEPSGVEERLRSALASCSENYMECRYCSAADYAITNALDLIKYLQSEVDSLKGALSVIEQGTRLDSGWFWPMREWLDSLGVYHNNVNNEYLFGLVARVALGIEQRKEADGVQGN